MKFAIVLLVTSIAATSAFAGETVCLNAKLTSNSHSNLSCGEVAQACVNGFEQNDNANFGDHKIKSESLLLANSKGEKVKIDGGVQTSQSMSDIDTRLFLSYYGSKVSASLEIETDSMDWEQSGIITGTFFNMTLMRAFSSEGNTQVQICTYSLSK